MKHFLICILIFFLFVIDLFSQGFPVVPSISNTLRYGSGERTIGTIYSDFNYFENLTDVRFQLPENFSAGFRLLYDVPPEVGLEFKGFQRRFFEYDDSKFYGRIGDFSQLYGRGLALNLFENRGLGYDTWMDGMKVKYTSDYFNLSALYGTVDFNDSITIARHEIHKIRGGNLEITPIKNLALGLTYIYSKSSIKLIREIKPVEINLPSIYLNFSLSDFTLLFDYAYKETKIENENKKSLGAGYYGALSYNIAGLGITLDYKNYFFDERDPFEKYDITRPTRMAQFQNPPIVMKEHSYTLLTRAIHEIDFNDETGLQLEVLKSIGESTELNFNASIASRHGYHKYNPSLFSFDMQERSLDFLPSFSNEYSPYWELFGEIVYYFDESTYAKLALARRDKTFYDEFFEGRNSHVIKSTVLPIQINHSLSNFYAVEFQGEFEKVFDNYNEKQKHFSNFLFTLINTFSSQFTLTARFEFTNNKFEVSGKQDWFTIETGLRITQGNILLASYGKERGGQVCSNGVCRYIQPFEGFRFSIITNI